MDKVSVGLLTIFNHETQEWELYKGRIEQWFLANEINDGVDKSGTKRRAILLSSFAETTYKLIRDLALPEEVSSLSYEQVVSLLDGHFKAKKCGFAERYKFHSALQGSSESLSEWAARVRGLAKDCNFPTSALNELLRDRFVLGMLSGKARERLFEKSLEGLTMEKTLQLAESVHCASEGARQAGASRPPAQDLALSPFVEVHKVTTQQGSSQGKQEYSNKKGNSFRPPKMKKKCSVCAFFGHESQNCSYKSYTCRVCGVRGHIQRACVAKKGCDSQHFLQYRPCEQADGDDAFLTLYLRSKLGYSDEGATEIYHVFSTFVYFFPILGGILADNYLGKFRTILYLMFVYAAGNILVAVIAIPQLEVPKRLCTIIGLLMITLGTGGIKPCVTAFGGDQFILPQQEKQLALYFSILYFNLCTGSLIAKTVSPILRSDVHCFGDKDCYSLAFGAPGFVVLLSIVIFVAAKSRYVMKNPEGNMVIDFVKCIFLGLKNAIVKGKSDKQSHWLDSTQHRFNKSFIRDVKKTLSILTLFTVLPVFWALLDQLGSRWTLQATKMDGRLGFITIKPDQLQVLNPICILILIPLFQKYLYPFLQKRNILTNPLHKLTLGGVLAGIAFIASAVVEIYIKTTYPELPQAGYSQLRVYNGNNCSISIRDNMIYTIPSLSHYANKHIRVNGTENVLMSLGGSCIEPRDEVFLLENNKAISFFVNGNDTMRFGENVDKSKSGLPVVRFLVTNRVISSNLTLYNEKRKEIESYIHTGISPQKEVFMSVYSIRVGDKTIMEDIELGQGGVYAIVIDKNSNVYQARVIVITEPNSITMALLLPQFLIMSVAEVLFAVTGNEFAFKEAPSSMKAVMTAVWLLTEAVGNVLIIIVTRVFVNYQQETQSFIYTGLMFTSIALFHYLSRGYQFHSDDDVTKKQYRSNSEVLYHQVKQAEDCLEH